MLQQTNVSTVINYYKKFISNWPTINSLSKAKLDTILFTWQGLGYYNRATNLYKTAKIICSKYNGKIVFYQQKQFQTIVLIRKKYKANTFF